MLSESLPLNATNCPVRRLCHEPPLRSVVRSPLPSVHGGRRVRPVTRLSPPVRSAYRCLPTNFRTGGAPFSVIDAHRSSKTCLSCFALFLHIPSCAMPSDLRLLALSLHVPLVFRCTGTTPYPATWLFCYRRPAFPPVGFSGEMLPVPVFNLPVTLAIIWSPAGSLCP